MAICSACAVRRRPGGAPDAGGLRPRLGEGVGSADHDAIEAIWAMLDRAALWVSRATACCRLRGTGAEKIGECPGRMVLTRERQPWPLGEPSVTHLADPQAGRQSGLGPGRPPRRGAPCQRSSPGVLTTDEASRDDHADGGCGWLVVALMPLGLLRRQPSPGSIGGLPSGSGRSLPLRSQA